MTARKSTKVSELLVDLNPVQRQAVQADEGPVLVLAGAGSGKTRVLTHRIAYLISYYKVSSERILAVTFTNKAANEMKSRLQQLLKTNIQHLWVGTFHAIFARILRRESAYIGFGRNFVIYDSEDQRRIVKQLMTNAQIPIKEYPPQLIHARISRLKNDMITPETFQSRIADRYEEVVHQIFVQYTSFLKSNNGMDFDDLITLPVQLFRQHPAVSQKYQELFQHILVDEFQDTNIAQNELVSLLGKKYQHVFVVGDDDQSIYRWRGAEVRNILEFEKTFPKCQVFRLEQNYRSTKNILDAAYSVVKNNCFRKEKRLWTEKVDGERLVLIEAIDENDEASKIVNRTRYEISHHKRNFRDFVVLYRTNAQSRAIEDALRRNTISYVIVGGIKFYERKEIKDFLAYLRVLINPKDDLSLQRILNVPARGIGAVTLSRLQDYANQKQVSLIEALQNVDDVVALPAQTRERLKELNTLFIKYRSLRSNLGFDELVRVLNDELGFLRMFKEEGTIEAMNRYDNVQELLSAISEYCQTRPEPTLENFLEEVALVTDIDGWDDQSNAVTLMTLHSAKGLEFPVVFISGLEEGLFPLARSKEDPQDFEEERRLFYVGLTRAKEQVYLSWAQNRRRYTEGFTNRMSSFIDEIEPQYLEKLVAKVSPPRRRPQLEVDYEPMPDYENENQINNIYIGCHVKHEQFGLGVVTRIEGQGENLKLKVFFNNVGEKKLLFRYAQLEIL